MGKKNWKKIAIGLWIFCGLLVLIGLLFPESELKSKYPSTAMTSFPDLSKATTYKIISKEDFSFPGRKRLGWLITSPASTLEARAQTVMKAAIDLQTESGAKVVNILLEISPSIAGKGYILAVARYSPGGGGFSGDQDWEWEVEATGEQVAKNSLKIAELWEINRKDFQDSNRITDETRLRKYLSKKLKIPFDEVHLPSFFLTKFPVKL